MHYFGPCASHRRWSIERAERVRHHPCRCSWVGRAQLGGFAYVLGAAPRQLRYPRLRNGLRGAVYECAERVTTIAPISVTGLVAGGATVVCFTTGRGSVLGTTPVPSIKIATNTAMFERLQADMDLDAGGVAEEYTTIDAIGKLIFVTVLEMASGRSPVSEDLGRGRDEFVPWQLGAVT